MEVRMSENVMVAKTLVKALEHEGVRYAFGIPGEENLELVKELHESEQIEVILCRHEQGAAFMADMVGRLTGRAGVCFSTLGPGATNLITGVADANGDGAPLVAITAQVSTERMPLTSHQYLDLETLFVPITKRTKMIMSPASTNEVVRLAFKWAEQDRPGATHICVPEDVAEMNVPEGAPRKLLNRSEKGREFAERIEIDRAATAINRAQRPVILVGHSAIRSNAAEAVKHFAMEMHIPVVNTMMAKGAIPCSNNYFMGTIGIPQKDYPNIILDQSDLVICIGYDIVELAPIKWNKKDNHRVMHIDTKPAHVNKLYQPEIEVVGDISYSLQKIGFAVQPKKDVPEIFAIRDEMRQEKESYASDTSYPIKPQKLLHDIRTIMGPDDILVSDVGAHKMWIARYYDCFEPNTCIISNGFATMGIALPGAIAAKMLHPEKRVLAVTGDGGFMMNNQELLTAVHYNVPIVVLVLRDGSYGLIKWKQDDRYHDHFCVDFTDPDFAAMAESMHVKGFRVSRTEDLIPTLEEAFGCGKPALVDVDVDYAENEKLTQYLEEVMRRYEAEGETNG